MRHSTIPRLVLLALGSGSLLQSHAYPSNPTPTVTLSNGADSTKFIGRSLPEFDQEVFLGIKYADKPVRFTHSTLKTAYASNDSDSGPVNRSSASGAVLYDASQYGYDCPGYGSDTTTLLEAGLIELNEDCLNLNVVRPKREESGDDELLPVMVWIFGGGWQQGATADPRYA